jgi:RNA polymerase sigma-70 factor (ECF subfamily)
MVERMIENTPYTDAELLQHAQGGSAEAFGMLYDRHAQAVFRFLYAHLNNRLDAEDLTGDVFLRSWRMLPKYREQGVPFLAYLFKVARNALIDFYRHTGNRSETEDIENVQAHDASQDPVGEAAARLENEELHHAIQELRDDYQTVLTLRFIGELSPEETAAVMGKSAGAIRVLQHRALAALRKLLESKEHFV